MQRETANITLRARHRSLDEVAGLADAELYRRYVRPLDYDFGVERDAWYAVVGMVFRTGTPWIYGVPAACSASSIEALPLALFDAEFRLLIPRGWVVTTNSRGAVELLPERLANIPEWYARALDADSEILSILDEILSL